MQKLKHKRELISWADSDVAKFGAMYIFAAIIGLYVMNYIKLYWLNTLKFYINFDYVSSKYINGGIKEFLIISICS